MLVAAVRARVAALAVCALLSSCASDVYRVPTDFRASGKETERSVVLARDVAVTPSTGYTRTLKAGTVWKYVGRVAEGKVYAVENDVFMLEGKHMHEAYCVIANGPVLVGFYLPVEQAFAPLPSSVPLTINYQQ